MAKDSAIEWTDHTFNPWWGCVKISEGCKNCYAEARQFGGDWWGQDKPRRFFGEKHWKQPIKWNEEAEKLGVRYKVFCGSYCDVFEEKTGLMAQRRRLWKLIEDTPNLDWLLLTKRPEMVLLHTPGYYWGNAEWPSNLWLGVSVENQKQADIRIPELLEIPAKVRFLSCEPLLEEIDLIRHWYQWGHDGTHRGIGSSECPRERHHHHDERCQKPFDWVIVGGESGPRKRPFDPEWARFLLKQCEKIDVPFFIKQMNKIDPIPDDLFIRQFPEVT